MCNAPWLTYGVRSACQPRCSTAEDPGPFCTCFIKEGKERSLQLDDQTPTAPPRGKQLDTTHGLGIDHSRSASSVRTQAMSAMVAWTHP
jgi:hypothetical protein